eukprot:gene14426-17055_t
MPTAFVSALVLFACHGIAQGSRNPLPSATDCRALPNCHSIFGSGIIEGCGWCWDTSITLNQTHGGRHGTFEGPNDGLGKCSDWTFDSLECQKHVDCDGDVPTCEGIVGTYCGWCVGLDGGSSGKAIKGTPSGPKKGVECGEWTWDHAKCLRSDGPEQVRLSMAGNAGEIYALTWASAAAGLNSSAVFHGPSASVTLPAETTYFPATNDAGFQYIHRVLLRGSAAASIGLTPGAPCEYEVSLCTEVQCLTRGPFRFANRRDVAAPGAAPLSVLVFGDMGRYGGGQVLRALKRELGGHGPTSGTSLITDAVIHVGDFAYDLATHDGLNGDTFFQRVEPLASSVPYMVTPGNHEIQTGGDEMNVAYFAQYRNRFTMPRGMYSGSTDGSDHLRGTDMWHSWNLGPVHFVSYSSEVFFSSSNATQQRMIDWLEQDLTAANTAAARAGQPWIVTFAHRPMYCSNIDGDDCTKKQGTYSYGRLTVYNGTAMRWQVVMAEQNKVVDNVLITK